MAVTSLGQIKEAAYDKTTTIRTEYNGLSTDVKPTDCEAGSIFHETDTMDIYEYDPNNTPPWFLTKLGARDIERPIYDNVGRQSLNSVFGEKITGVRKPTIAAQFQYGFNTYEATSTLANGGTVTTANASLVVSTGTNIAGSAAIQTKRALRYVPGHQAYSITTPVFTKGVANSYQRIGIFDAQNGFFVGFEGDVFGVTRRRAGVSYFIPQSSFNIDKIDGTGKSGFNYDPTKGTIISVSYGFLGYATVNFEILSETGEWILFHRINYPNTSNETHIANSNLPLRAEVGNSGNNTNVTMRIGSVSAGIIDGAGADPSTRSFSSQIPPVTVSATSGVLALFRNKTTYNSITNYTPALLDLISVAVDGNKNMTIQLIKNPTITNSPTWVDVDANSVLERSVNGTVNVATGQLLLSANIQKVGDFYQLVNSLDFQLYPGEHAAFVWSTTSGVTSQVDLGIRWSELF